MLLLKLNCSLEKTDDDGPFLKKEAGIFIANLNATTFQLYKAIDFFSSIGGLLGLCVGVSAMSIVEFVYYFCVRPASQKMIE